MNTMQDFVAHPQLSARRRWSEVATPGRPVQVLAPPVAIDNEPATMGAMPALRAHTDSVLRELGFSDQAIAAWRAEGTI